MHVFISKRLASEIWHIPFAFSVLFGDPELKVVDDNTPLPLIGTCDRDISSITRYTFATDLGIPKLAMAHDLASSLLPNWDSKIPLNMERLVDISTQLQDTRTHQNTVKCKAWLKHFKPQKSSHVHHQPVAMSAVGLSTRGPLAAPMATAAFRAALAMDVKNSQGAMQLLSDLGRYGGGFGVLEVVDGYGYEVMKVCFIYLFIVSVVQFSKKVMLYCNSDTRLFVTVCN